MLKELQNNSHFAILFRLCLILLYKKANTNTYQYRYLTYCKVNFTSYSAHTKKLADKKGTIYNSNWPQNWSERLWSSHDFLEKHARPTVDVALFPGPVQSTCCGRTHKQLHQLTITCSSTWSKSSLLHRPCPFRPANKATVDVHKLLYFIQKFCYITHCWKE